MVTPAHVAARGDVDCLSPSDIACAGVRVDVADHQGQKPPKGKTELDARAVFKQRCYRCHSGEKPKGDFDLEHIDPKTRAAEILDRITSRDEEFWMPPAKRLTVQQLAAVFAELGKHVDQAHDLGKGADG